MPEIKSIVREEVVSASLDTPVTDVARLMEEEDVGSVVVLENERPRGIITDRDIALEVVARERDPGSLVASDVMTEGVMTVRIDAGIFDVIRTMREAKVRRMPATDADGRIAGIVSFDDFVILLGRELNQLGGVVEAEIPPYEHA